MNALRLFSGIAVVVGCHASLLPASTLPLTHAGHLPALTSYTPHALTHHSQLPAVAPYSLGHHGASYASHALNHYAPAVETTQHHSQDEYGQYDFGYSGGPSARHETGDAYGNVRGSYSYFDAYGQVQKQSYVADAHGFRVVGTNLPTSGHHHLGKRSADASFPASTGPLSVGHHAVAHVAHAAHHVAPVVHAAHHVAPVAHIAHAAHRVAPVVHSAHHVAHAAPVAHHATHYTTPGAHVSHVATHPNHGYGYGHSHGAFSYGFSAASPLHGYGYNNHYAQVGHY
ncbi:unnamed protein product [Meganyctiphanes norvegica]|uniref:Cuticle protein n=1 Tax=Meganyctiphanes norvegica TaxID=48144 RepID=A0AAV2PN09_MEGNR